jgi:hypothetical protein
MNIPLTPLRCLRYAEEWAARTPFAPNLQIISKKSITEV